ncbi:MAG: DUF2812 domain-containing protein [Velocimicrobium sp.]
MSKNKKKRANRTYRLPPCPPYDVEGIESWLASMAEKGWVLSQEGFFAGVAIFEKCKPHSIRYRMEAARKSTSMWADDDGAPSEEEVELNETYGWQYVTIYDKFYIYCTDRSDARELHTDSKVQALTLDIVCKKERSNFIGTILWILIYPIIWMRGNLVLCAIDIGTWFLLWGIVLALWTLGRSIVRFFYFKDLRRRLSSGQSLNHLKKYKKYGGFYHLRGIAFHVLIVAWFAFLMYGWSEDMEKVNVQTYADYTGEIPFPTIADLAPEGTCILQDLLYTNTIEVKKDWLAPSVITLHENARITRTDKTALEGGLIVNYYETASPWIAKEIAREYLIEDKKDQAFEALSLIDTDIDFAVAYRTIFPTVILQNGNKVMRVIFYQTSESYEMPMQEWVQIFSDSFK